MTLKSLFLTCATVLGGLAPLSVAAQVEPSMYGDKVKADIKVNYVRTLDEALTRAKAEKKPIFFNCYADWAIPCHGMDIYVFSNQEFADYLHKNFIPFYMDVSKRQNAAIAKRYNIHRFAHFLVLDAEGNVIQRIIGGKQLPDFQKDLALSLSPKTSLAGLSAAYQKGKRDKKTLRNYLYALNLADDSTFNQVAQEYWSQLSEKEYAKEDNWFILSHLITDRQAPLYHYLVEHRDAFVKNVGEAKVNGFLERMFYSEAAAYASGTAPYDADALLDLSLGARKAAIADTSAIYPTLKLAELRGTKQYDALIDFMEKEGAKFQSSRASYELTFDFPDLNAQQTQRLCAYLRQRSKVETGSAAKQLSFLADRLEKNDGIIFEHLTLKEALAKAKESGKQVFVDCFTEWCGPCKMLARDVFPRPEVGKVFNARFVNLKMDMEKGEGLEVAKRYGITAYPTLLVINPDGTVAGKVVGARLQIETFLEEVEKIPTATQK